MFYLETIKKLYGSIKNNSEIPQEEKKTAEELLTKLSNLLMLY